MEGGSRNYRMGTWRPCKWREFIRRLRKLGFQGPYRGNKYESMVPAGSRLAIPSNKECSVPQLNMMIKEVERIVPVKIDLEKWNTL